MSLKWNHESLDRLCREIQDFETLLWVAERPEEFGALQSLIHAQLIPSSALADLRLVSLALDRHAPGAIQRMARESRVDAAVFIIGDETEPRKLSGLLRSLEKIPCAYIVLARAIPAHWTEAFETLVHFQKGTAQILWRDGRRRASEPLELLPAARPLHPGPPRVGLYGVEDRLLTILTDALVAARCAPRHLAFGELGGSVVLPQIDLLVYGGAWQGAETEELLRLCSASFPVVLLGDRLLRADDRAAAYRGGAALVLPRQASPEEVVAAIFSRLQNPSSESDPFRELDREFAQAARHVRRDRPWQRTEAELAVPYYRALIENQLRRAAALDCPPGGLVLKLPPLPRNAVEAGWAKALQSTLIDKLLSTVRDGDVTLVVEDRLVILSHQMDMGAAQAILTRARQYFSELNLGQPTGALLEGPVQTGRAGLEDAADRWIRSAFGKGAAEDEGRADLTH